MLRPQAQLRTRGPGDIPAPDTPPQLALALVAIWLIGALVVSALFTERAEIGG